MVGGWHAAAATVKGSNGDKGGRQVNFLNYLLLFFFFSFTWQRQRQTRALPRNSQISDRPV